MKIFNMFFPIMYKNNKKILGAFGISLNKAARFITKALHSCTSFGDLKVKLGVLIIFVYVY